MTARLLSLTPIPALLPAQSVVVAHGLNITDIGIKPDLVAIVGATEIVVTATTTMMTVMNTGASPTLPFSVLAWHLHSIERALGGNVDELSPQPVIIGQSGPGGVEGCDCPGAGVQSTRVGLLAQAFGQRSTAIGYSAGASNDDATAVGWNAEATLGNTALGASTFANAPGTTAVGQAAEATSPAGTALGNGALAHGVNATVLGQAALGLDHAIVIGRGASGNGGITIGENQGGSPNEIRIGHGAGIPSLIDDFQVLGKDLVNPMFFRAIGTPPDILPGGGVIGILVCVNRGGVQAVEQVFCGPAGSGPGGAGRALYIVD